MITWDDPNTRYYHHGLDHGVVYIPGIDPLPWNGLTAFDEGNSPGQTSILYRDGIVYLSDVEAGDFSGQMKAIYYPDPFGACIGIPEATDGLFVDSQKPKPFNLSYRTLVGSGAKGDRFGYQLHLVYNCMASIGSRGRQTINNDKQPVEMTFDIVCTPVKLPGYRPSAHYIIDTRGMSPAKIAEIETILYGDGVTPGMLPDPLVLYDLMNFGDAIVVTSHGDGTFDVEGSNDNVILELDDETITLKNINATAPAADGSYTISDGGTTTVVVG
jgi:hypothetical protein